MFRLGAVNQYNDMEYVIRHTDGTTKCLLCETGYMRKHERNRHFNGCRHEFNYQEVKRCEQSIVDERKRSEFIKWCDGIKVRVEMLGLPKWKYSLKSKMFDFIYRTHVAGDGVRQIILLTLLGYEKLEATSLLELALWKSNIVCDVVFSSMQEMREYSILEQGFDPEEYARIRRVTCGSEVVIPLVVSFLP